MTTDRHMQVAAELLEAAQKRAAQAEADRDTLAAEVMAWRESFGKLFDFTHATANQGALTRAKEAK